MPIIALSRGTFAGARSLCKVLSARLELPCVSREVFLEETKAFGFDTTLMWRSLEDAPSLFDLDGKERDLLLLLFSRLLLERAVDGDFVYHGHHIRRLLTGVPNVLRVRVVAPLDQRVQVVQRDTGMSARKARVLIRRIDKQRARWMRFFHNLKWEDPILYDVTLNLEDMSVEDAADAVCALAETSRFDTNQDTHDKVRNAALAAAVRYELAAAGYLFGSNVEVTAKEGVVEVVGNTQWHETRQTIGEIVQGVPGVKEVHNLVRSRSAPEKRASAV